MGEVRLSDLLRIPPLEPRPRVDRRPPCHGCRRAVRLSDISAGRASRLYCPRCLSELQVEAGRR